jgi:transposase
MSKAKKYSPEVRERSVRMVLEIRKDHPSLWSAVQSVAAKIGCTATTLNEWVKRYEIDHGVRDGQSSAERDRVKALEREVKKLRSANEILKVASAFFAQAHMQQMLDRRLK